MDRILILAPYSSLVEECCEALKGLGVELVAVEAWAELEEQLRQRGARLVLLFSPLRGGALGHRVARLRRLEASLPLFALWWDDSEQGAVERLLAGVNQIYALPCSATRLRQRVEEVLLHLPPLRPV